MANKIGCTVGQLCIAWALRRHVAVATKVISEFLPPTTFKRIYSITIFIFGGIIWSCNQYIPSRRPRGRRGSSKIWRPRTLPIRSPMKTWPKSGHLTSTSGSFTSLTRCRESVHNYVFVWSDCPALSTSLVYLDLYSMKQKYRNKTTHKLSSRSNCGLTPSFGDPLELVQGAPVALVLLPDLDLVAHLHFEDDVVAAGGWRRRFLLELLPLPKSIFHSRSLKFGIFGLSTCFVFWNCSKTGCAVIKIEYMYYCICVSFNMSYLISELFKQKDKKLQFSLQINFNYFLHILEG